MSAEGTITIDYIQHILLKPLEFRAPAYPRLDKPINPQASLNLEELFSEEQPLGMPSTDSANFL